MVVTRSQICCRKEFAAIKMCQYVINCRQRIFGNNLPQTFIGFNQASCLYTAVDFSVVNTEPQVEFTILLPDALLLLVSTFSAF